MIRACLRARAKGRRKVGTKEADGQPQRPSLVPLSLALLIGEFGYVVFIAFAPLKNELAAEYKTGRGMSSYDFEYFYGLMYTAYGLPNFFMPLLAGVIIDRIGASKVLMFCSGLNGLGTFLVAVGSLLLRPSIVLSGRLILGFGNESVYVAAMALIGEFLPIKNIAYMSGIISAGTFIANSVGSLLAVPAFEHAGIPGLCVLLGAAAVLQFCANLEVLRQKKLIESADKLQSSSKMPGHEMAQVSESSQMDASDDGGRPPEKVTPRSFVIYILVVLISVFNTVCVWNFSMILCPLIEETWPPAKGESVAEAEERAGAWEFLFMLVPAFGNPIIGAGCSALGVPGLFLLWSACLQSVGHAIFAFASHVPAVFLAAGPLLPLVMVAHSNSFMAPMLLTCITLCLPMQHAAKAFGLMVVIQNIVMGLWPLLVAHLEVSSGNYQSSKVAFEMSALFGLVCVFWMMALDSKFLGGLNALLTRTQYCEQLLGIRTNNKANRAN